MSSGDTTDIFVPTQPLSQCDNRIKELIDFFVESYSVQPTIVVRVPGRVNLIGEHIDYCGYPVLPMAIEQCIYVAAAPSADDILSVKNVNPKYKNYKTSINDIQ